MGVSSFWMAQLVRLRTASGRTTRSAAASRANFCRRHEDTASLIAAVSALLQRGSLLTHAVERLHCASSTADGSVPRKSSGSKLSGLPLMTCMPSAESTVGDSTGCSPTLESMGLSANNISDIWCYVARTHSSSSLSGDYTVSFNWCRLLGAGSTASGTEPSSTSECQNVEDVCQCLARASALRCRMWRRRRVRQPVPKRSRTRDHFKKRRGCTKPGWLLNHIHTFLMKYYHYGLAPQCTIYELLNSYDPTAHCQNTAPGPTSPQKIPPCQPDSGEASALPSAPLVEVEVKPGPAWPSAAGSQSHSEGPVIHRPQIRALLCAESWKDILGIPDMKSTLRHHCVLCHQWTAKGGLKRRVKAMHPEEWQLEPEFESRCQIASGIRARPSAACGETFVASTRHRCTFMWQLILLRSLLLKAPPSTASPSASLAPYGAHTSAACASGDELVQSRFEKEF